MLAGKGRKAACDQPVGQERSVDQVDLAEAEAHLSELIARVVNRQFPSIKYRSRNSLHCEFGGAGLGWGQSLRSALSQPRCLYWEVQKLSLGPAQPIPKGGNRDSAIDSQ
jgi:hypothetical protein